MAPVSRPTRQRVLDAALVAFSERGFAATSLDDLAGDLGLTKQAILYHFGSKDSLLSAVIDRTAAELVGLFDAEVDRSGRGFSRIESVVRVTRTHSHVVMFWMASWSCTVGGTRSRSTSTSVILMSAPFA